MPKKKKKLPDYLEDCPPPIYFPSFIGKKIWRQYAVLQGQEIVTLTGRYPWQTATELISLLFTENLLLLINSWSDLSDECLELCFQHGYIWCTPRGDIRSFQLFGERRTTRWIVDCNASWGLPATVETLLLLTDLMGHCQAGTATSPGSLGMLLMRQSWAKHYGPSWAKHRHRRPSHGVCQWLQETCIGGRSEVLVDPDIQFKELIELDEKNAYGDKFRKEPTGKSTEFYGDDVSEYATYYAQVTITLDHCLDYGLFQIKDVTGNHSPTEPGIYETTAWREEIEFWRSEGVQVSVEYGTGWYEFTQDTSHFVQDMETLRDTAATQEIADLCKQGLVAGMGRLNMRPVRWRLTDEPQETALLAENGQSYPWYPEEIQDTQPQTMPHWYNYTVAMMRLALTQEALYWHKQEKLVATNCDAVYILPDADVSEYADRSQKKKVASGTWTKKKLHKVRFPANRHLVSREKTRRPGLARAG